VAALWLAGPPVHAQEEPEAEQAGDIASEETFAPLDGSLPPDAVPVVPQEELVLTGDSLTMGASLPEYYVVVAGDTLWEISNKFLGNPYYWPRLWSLNEQITNPHWIYPGNRVRFTLGTLLEPPEVGLEGEPGRDGYTVESLSYGDAEAGCGPDIRFNATLPATRYQSLGFVAADDDVDIFGRVPKARTLQTHLSEHDLIYLDLEEPDAFDCGDVVTLFRPVKKRARSREGRPTKYGRIYRVVGEARIVNRYGKYLSAVVRTSYTEIHRGDLVGPLMPVSVELEVQKPKGDLDGEIFARLGGAEYNLSAQGETVFVDRGRADGVRVGNSFYIYEQRDENLDRKREDTEVPPAVIGRAVVVRVDEYFATAVVTDANRPIASGTRVAMAID
jgi:hypothetical protein